MNRFEKKDLDAVAYRLVQTMNKETPSMPAEPYDPASSKTKLWLDEVVETAKKRHKRVMRALRTGAVVSCSIFLFITSTFTVDAARKKMYYFFDKAFAPAQQAEQTWDHELNRQVIKHCHNVYLPTWMPQGYIADSFYQDSMTFSITYIASNNREIEFKQRTTSELGYSDAEIENLKTLHFDNQILYFGKKNVDEYQYSSLMWQTDGIQFKLVASSRSITQPASQEELLKIYQSLQYKEG